MANGYGSQPVDPIAQLREALLSVQRRLSELEALDGSQIYNTVQDLKNLIDGLVNQVNGNFTGTLTVGGSTQLNGALNVPNAYVNNIAGVGGYKVAYWGVNGEAGYVPSSMQFKQDVEPAGIDPQAVLDIVPVRYRYKDAVANFGDAAALEFGVIAEQVDDLGLTWLIDYEVAPDGTHRPLGFKYERLAIGLLQVVRTQQERLNEIEERLSALEG